MFATKIMIESVHDHSYLYLVPLRVTFRASTKDFSLWEGRVSKPAGKNALCKL
jgi:hypothetical protein